MFTKRLQKSDFWLVLAQWGVLFIGMLTIGVFLAGISPRVAGLTATADTRALASLKLTPNAYAWYVVSLDFIVVFAHAAIASFIYWRKRHDWMVLFVSLTLVTNGAVLPLRLIETTSHTSLLWQEWAGVVIFCGLVTSIVLLYIFPTGQFIPSWTKLLVPLWVLLIVFVAFAPNSIFSVTTWPMPLKLTALLLWIGSGATAQIYRYRRVSTPTQRQQTKWASLGLTAAALGPLAYALITSVLPSFQASDVPNLMVQRAGTGLFITSFLVRMTLLSVFRVALILFPVTFAIAILRYRLWDIDLIIRRTLIYGILSAILLFIYVSGVVILELLFFIFTGESSEWAIVASTLALALLFNPIRHRVQNSIDHRFYRRKYDAQLVLARFGQTMRDEVALDELAGHLLKVLEETMQPTRASVWFKRTPKERSLRPARDVSTNNVEQIEPS